jgi:ABC-type multidrug transport system permease subunit
VSIIIGLGDIAYSFYIASQVYGQFDEFQQGLVNCSSPTYYSSFVSVVIIFLYISVEIALVVLLCLWLILDFRYRIGC